MASKDLRKQQRAKLLSQGLPKPKVTLTAEKSHEASKKSIDMISRHYSEFQR